MSKIFLHLGCGPIKLPGFINIDNEPSHNPDVCMDYLYIENQFANVDGIYSCHSIEHLKYPTETDQFFRACHNVLKPGSTLRIVVPDLMKVATKYVNGESLRDIYHGDFFYHMDLPAERFMYFCREWSHQILFDQTLLMFLMRDAGFKMMKVCTFGESDIKEFCGIDRFESESICMEAAK